MPRWLLPFLIACRVIHKRDKQISARTLAPTLLSHLTQSSLTTASDNPPTINSSTAYDRLCVPLTMNDNPSGDIHLVHGTFNNRNANATSKSLPDDQKQGDSAISCSGASTDVETRTGDTICYKQEPYQTFRHKVMELLTLVLRDYDIETEYMKGGAFNRVVGINVALAAPTSSLQYWLRFYLLSILGSVKVESSVRRFVIRIPRDTLGPAEFDISFDVSAYRFARHCLGNLIPQVIHFDTSSTNPINSPYMVLDRIRGQNLLSVWEKLNLAQKKSVMRSFVDVMSTL